MAYTVRFQVWFLFWAYSVRFQVRFLHLWADGLWMIHEWSICHDTNESCHARLRITTTGHFISWLVNNSWAIIRMSHVTLLRMATTGQPMSWHSLVHSCMCTHFRMATTGQPMSWLTNHWHLNERHDSFMSHEKKNQINAFVGIYWFSVHFIGAFMYVHTLQNGNYRAAHVMAHESLVFNAAPWTIHLFNGISMISLVYSCVWQDSFMGVTWLIHVCDMTHSWYVRHDSFSFTCVTRLIDACDMTHSCVWHDSSICVTWLIHVCDLTRLCVWQDSSLSATWLIDMCDMMHWYV